MQNSTLPVESLFNDLDRIVILKRFLSERLEYSDDSSIDQLIDQFEFFSKKVHVFLLKHHSNPETKIAELQNIANVPDFNDQHIDYSEHFSQVEKQYRTFLRNLKYEGRTKKPNPQPASNTEVPILQNKNDKVFLVHGHDSALKTEVARFIENQNIEVIILHEQANRGSTTIIEKIESYSNVGFAIILYTPCDVGKSMQESDSDFKPRARQNVIFEHGYFTAKLGRSRVSALLKGSVEIPNDFSGVVYENYDQSGAWKFKLGNELHSAGYDIDFSKIKL